MKEYISIFFRRYESITIMIKTHKASKNSECKKSPIGCGQKIPNEKLSEMQIRIWNVRTLNVAQKKKKKKNSKFRCSS